MKNFKFEYVLSLLPLAFFFLTFYLLGVIKFIKFRVIVFGLNVVLAGLIIIIVCYLLNKYLSKSFYRGTLKVLFAVIVSITMSILAVQDTMVFGGYFYDRENRNQEILDHDLAQILAEPKIEALEIESKGTTLKGLVRHGETSHANVIIIYNGNGGLSTYNMRAFSKINSDAHIILMDHRGYNGSKGFPSAKNVRNDALVIFDHVKEAYPESDLFVMGWSIGTELATHVAANRDVNGVILVAAFDDMVDIYNETLDIFHGPLEYLIKYRFSPLKNAMEIDEEIMLLISKSDGMFSVEMSERIKAASKGVTTLHIIDGVGHGNYFGNDYIENSSKLVNDFIEKVQNR